MRYRNLNDPGNGAKYRTGKACIDCEQPAGTLWSKLWCVQCNIKRMDRINQAFDKIVRGEKPKETA